MKKHLELIQNKYYKDSIVLVKIIQEGQGHWNVSGVIMNEARESWDDYDDEKPLTANDKESRYFPYEELSELELDRKLFQCSYGTDYGLFELTEEEIDKIDKEELKKEIKELKKEISKNPSPKLEELEKKEIEKFEKKQKELQKEKEKIKLNSFNPFSVLDD